MRFAVVNNDTSEVVSSYYGKCMANAVMPAVKSKRIKEIIEGKPVYEEIERPHFLTAFANTALYRHVLVPAEYETVDTEDLMCSADDVVSASPTYLERLEAEKWGAIRKKRNELLTASDWTMLRDVPHSLVWEEYRQILRDLPSAFDKADDAIYPSPPG